MCNKLFQKRGAITLFSLKMGCKGSGPNKYLKPSIENSRGRVESGGPPPPPHLFRWTIASVSGFSPTKFRVAISNLFITKNQPMCSLSPSFFLSLSLTLTHKHTHTDTHTHTHTRAHAHTHRYRQLLLFGAWYSSQTENIVSFFSAFSVHYKKQRGS